MVPANQSLAALAAGVAVYCQRTDRSESGHHLRPRQTAGAGSPRQAVRDLAHTFHSFYNDNHVLSESEDNLSSIMSALNALKIVFGNALNLLGISPLTKM